QDQGPQHDLRMDGRTTNPLMIVLGEGGRKDTEVDHGIDLDQLVMGWKNVAQGPGCPRIEGTIPTAGIKRTQHRTLSRSGGGSSSSTSSPPPFSTGRARRPYPVVKLLLH